MTSHVFVLLAMPLWMVKTIEDAISISPFDRFMCLINVKCHHQYKKEEETPSCDITLLKNIYKVSSTLHKRGDPFMWHCCLDEYKQSSKLQERGGDPFMWHHCLDDGELSVTIQEQRPTLQTLIQLTSNMQ